ncbi:hypothetical protein FEK30_06940 [Picosynechococcus sp. PCC 11901]|uniref:hypothetical protein n=1 Tax=Picosynechococcus sp. PCC 11901 TaxID=2579791 RepID=UPI0010FBCF24|nr:hypothetical protein [Picosynechococcus sp. PCC 11901]QCS49190.1 hypothetical protein FEK30_06940 [Picosynechococcus sp. PCC 11901]
MTFPQCTDKVFLGAATNHAPGLPIFQKVRPLWKRLGQLVIFGVILLNLWGCTGTEAPREFAPDGEVIQRAIATKLKSHYQQLSQTINAPPPNLELKNIQVKKLDSFFLQALPVYHLQGTYDVVLNFPSQRTENRRRNPFEVYLQRQPEGKTWRSLEKNPQGWRSQQLPR